ncbi:MAG: hypothetical protein QMD71_04875 [bacterium]|nr:hypothetical protein [bacterium]
MAKYFGSAFGTITGKIGNLVFQRHGKTRVIKMHNPYPKDRGSMNTMNKLIKHKIEESEVNIRRINTKIVFGTVSFIYSQLKPIIEEPWRILIQQKKNITHYDLFMKYNTSPLYQSIPDKQRLISYTNMPKLKSIIITEGDLLEQTQITKAKYTTSTGKLQIEWTTNTLLKGKTEDNAHIVPIYWKQTKKLTFKPWKKIKIWIPVLPAAKRKDGKATIYIEPKLTLSINTQLIIFLFFTSNAIYSRSIATQITQ